MRYAKIAIKEVKNNKISIICLSIIMTLIIITNMISTTIYTYRNRINANWYTRLLRIEYENEEQKNEIIDRFNNIINVVQVFESYYYGAYFESNYFSKNIEDEYKNTSFFAEGFNNEALRTVVENVRFSNEDAYEVVLPDKVLISRNTDTNEKEFVDSMEYIGQNIEYEILILDGYKKVSSKTINLKVIGVYSIDKMYGIPENIILIPYKLMDIIKQDNINQQNEKWIGVMVNSVVNTSNVYNEIKKLDKENNLSLMISDKVEDSVITNEEIITGISKNIITLINVISIVIDIYSFMVLIYFAFFNAKKRIINKSKDIGCLKVQGYTDSQLQIIHIIENIAISLISIIIFLIILLILKMFYNNMIYNEDLANIKLDEIRLLLKNIKFKINIVVLLASYLVYLVIMLTLGHKSMKKWLKKDIAEMLQEKEN